MSTWTRLTPRGPDDRERLSGVWSCGSARLRRIVRLDGRAMWKACQHGRTSRMRPTAPDAVADVGAPPCPVCSCGYPLVRGVGPRARMLGELLEYCPCSRRGCGSTSCVVVEACQHGRIVRTSGGPVGARVECEDCGHSWAEL